MVGLAPSASAARTLEQESGIESHTLQHFLAKYAAIADGRADRQLTGEARSEINGAIIVVDEASLASTRQMHNLMKISEALTPGRLALVGDSKQLDAVDAGVPFRQLQHGGMETAVMDQIMRQRDPDLKAAVLDALEGKPAEALDKLGEDILEAPRHELGTIAAQRWLMLDADARERTGLMAPTHALRDEINEVVRADLKRDGLLRGQEAMIERLDPLRHTIAEKEMAGTYLPGHVMIFERDPRAADIRAGIADRVIAVLDSTHQEPTNEKTFYVEISRARDRAIIVTDDRMQLAETLVENTGEL